MPTALIGPAIGAIGTIGGALLGGHAAKSAAKDQAKAAQAGIDEFKTDLSPWLKAGQSSLGGLLAMLGLNGADAQMSAITGLQNSPLFTSLYGQGKEAILQSAAATGGLRGGNTEHSLFDLGSNLLAQVMQQQIGNLGALSGQGLTAGGDMASAIANLLGQKGAAQAGGAMGQAQGFAGALNGLTGFLQTPGLFGGGMSSALQGATNFSNSFGAITNAPSF